LKIRNLIKATLFVSALINLSPAGKATQFFTKDTKNFSQFKSVNWDKVVPKHINVSSNRLFQKYKNNYISNSKFQAFQTYSDKFPLILANARDIKNELEIQSEMQSEENNILKAKGNVLATFKGNSLRTDRLIYDKLNKTLKAEGNIELILKEQVFRAEEMTYDFKSQKGKFLKVKGLIKTKSFINNLEFDSYNSNEKALIIAKIVKDRVLHTPNGIDNWIFYTDELKVEDNKWTAQKAIFTNDLLETDQVKFIINKLKIIPKKDKLKIKSSISYLLLENKLSIPFWFGNRTLNKSKEGYIFDFNSKWYYGIDNLDRDGYFIGRKLNPINISNEFVIELEPQFLIQRSLQGYTKSFVNKDDSITADKAKRDTTFVDYFALNTELKGKITDWDLKINKTLYSFDSEKFLQALRFKVDLTKEIDFLNSKWDNSFFGVYRDSIWNGSIGESEIYLGIGSKLTRSNTWKVNGITKTENFTIGFGEFKGEGLNSENLLTSYKGSLFYSLDQKFPLNIKEAKTKFIDKSFNYIFEPINKGIYINTQLSALYSLYDNGNHQEYFGFGAGPEIVFGDFKKKYFDYTRVKLFPFYRITGGESIFKFDQISDKFTLDIAYDQQVYGPILLKTNATINLDGNSKNYGDFINSKISLNWKKRSYELGIFYQPHNQSGGINFALFGFE